jgi:hypothetical protein
MAFNFPSNPTLNQQSTQNGRVYNWSGTAWELAASVASHKSTHAVGGSDALAPSDIGAATTSHSHSGADIISGTISNDRLSGNAQASINLYLWANFR